MHATADDIYRAVNRMPHQILDHDVPLRSTPQSTVAEAEGHHPDIALAWGRVDVKTYTHKIDGLTESDFVLAAKVDQEFFNRPKA